MEPASLVKDQNEAMSYEPSFLTKPLIGTDEATIDDKGRLLVSKKKRERLGEPFVMALGETGCIVAYPQETWHKVLSEIASNPSTNQGRQQFARMTTGTAEDELKFDKQGRVVIPQKLREAANITDKVVLVGCLDRLEIWSKDEHDAYEADMDSYGSDRREAMDRAHKQMTGKDSQ